MEEKIAPDKTGNKRVAKSNALHLAKKHVPRKRNAVHAKRTNVREKVYRNNAPSPATDANLVDRVETNLARIKQERKNVERTRENVRRVRRCKRIVPRRARSARNKQLTLDFFQWL